MTVDFSGSNAFGASLSSATGKAAGAGPVPDDAGLEDFAVLASAGGQ